VYVYSIVCIYTVFSVRLAVTEQPGLATLSVCGEVGDEPSVPSSQFIGLGNNLSVFAFRGSLSSAGNCTTTAAIDFTD
jgi:hypothetical protein